MVGQCLRTISSEVVIENLEEGEGVPGVWWLLCQNLQKPNFKVFNFNVCFQLCFFIVG